MPAFIPVTRFFASGTSLHFDYQMYLVDMKTVKAAISTDCIPIQAFLEAMSHRPAYCACSSHHVQSNATQQTKCTPVRLKPSSQLAHALFLFPGTLAHSSRTGGHPSTCSLQLHCTLQRCRFDISQSHCRPRFPTPFR